MTDVFGVLLYKVFHLLASKGHGTALCAMLRALEPGKLLTLALNSEGGPGKRHVWDIMCRSGCGATQGVTLTEVLKALQKHGAKPNDVAHEGWQQWREKGDTDWHPRKDNWWHEL